jgi:hypothetical protein
MDKPQNTRAAAKTRPKTARGGERPETPNSAFNRWIEAKPHRDYDDYDDAGEGYRRTISDTRLAPPASNGRSIFDDVDQ